MNKKSKEYCLYCGAQMIYGKDRADKHYSGPWWGMTKARYASFDEDGKLQMVETYTCPRINNIKWWHYPKPKHDSFFREIEGKKYRMNFDDVISLYF